MIEIVLATNCHLLSTLTLTLESFKVSFSSAVRSAMNSDWSIGNRPANTYNTDTEMVYTRYVSRTAGEMVYTRHVSRTAGEMVYTRHVSHTAGEMVYTRHVSHTVDEMVYTRHVSHTVDEMVYTRHV